MLKPIGITRMKIGKSLLEHRAAGEVRYFTRGSKRTACVFAPNVGKKVPLAYGGWHHKAMDAHGAWIASAVDLARFAAAIDRPRKSKILTPKSIAAMFGPPAAPVSRTKDGKVNAVYYGLGWLVRGSPRQGRQHVAYRFLAGHVDDSGAPARRAQLGRS